jgi:hypothetical protein
MPLKNTQPENWGDSNTVSFTNGKSLNFGHTITNLIIKKYI